MHEPLTGGEDVAGLDQECGHHACRSRCHVRSGWRFIVAHVRKPMTQATCGQTTRVIRQYQTTTVQSLFPGRSSPGLELLMTPQICSRRARVGRRIRLVLVGPTISLDVSRDGQHVTLEIAQLQRCQLAAAAHWNRRPARSSTTPAQALQPGPARTGPSKSATASSTHQLAGRVLRNGWPTGVAVCWSQRHGCPYPATTGPRTHVSSGAVDPKISAAVLLSVYAGALAPRPSP